MFHAIPQSITHMLFVPPLCIVSRGWLVILEQQCCHSGAFSPSLSERRRDGDNMDEHGENDIKAMGLYLYDNGPLWAGSHVRGFAIPFCFPLSIP